MRLFRFSLPLWQARSPFVSVIASNLACRAVSSTTSPARKAVIGGRGGACSLIDCYRNLLDWPTGPVPSATVWRHSMHAGFAIISLIKLSFTWDMAFLLAHTSFDLSLLDGTAGSPATPRTPTHTLPSHNGMLNRRSSDIDQSNYHFKMCFIPPLLPHGYHGNIKGKRSLYLLWYSLTSPSEKTIRYYHYPLCGSSAEVRRDKQMHNPVSSVFPSIRIARSETDTHQPRPREMLLGENFQQSGKNMQFAEGLNVSLMWG